MVLGRGFTRDCDSNTMATVNTKQFFCMVNFWWRRILALVLSLSFLLCSCASASATKDPYVRTELSCYSGGLQFFEGEVMENRNQTSISGQESLLLL